MSPALMALVKVQLRLYLKNRKALIIHLLMPVLIATFFGSLFGGGGGGDGPSPIRAGWVDEDRSALSEAIRTALAADPALELLILDRAEAQAQVRRGKLPAALVLPAGFGEQAGRALMSGRKAEAALLFDPSDRISMNLLRGLFAQYAMRETLTRSFAGPSGAQRLQEFEGALGAQNLPAERREALQSLFRSLRTLQDEPQAAPPNAPAGAATAGGGEVAVRRRAALAGGAAGGPRQRAVGGRTGRRRAGAVAALYPGRAGAQRRPAWLQRLCAFVCRHGRAVRADAGRGARCRPVAGAAQRHVAAAS